MEAEKNSPFCQKLKSLRGKQRVEDLAKASGCPASSIYKAEHTAKIKWQTVEKIYGSFLHDEQLYCEVLIAWALEQASRRVQLYTANQHANKLMREGARHMNEKAQEIDTILSKLSPPDHNLALRFIRKFSESQSTRAMAKAWLQALNE